jgi:alkylation response protein AidB-like acyl-CoA dehydrogenase
VDRMTLPDYDRFAQAGMAFTEKQGGSDLRANSTIAEPLGDGWYELTGHKWFCSVPQSDGFFIQRAERQSRQQIQCVVRSGIRRDYGYPCR